MNYGKLAYLKVSELEKEMAYDGSKQIQSSALDCFELENDNFNENISSNFSLEFATITPSNSSDCCIFLKFKITATTATTVTLNLTFDDMLVSTYTRNIGVGESEVSISSVGSGVITDVGTLAVSISTTMPVVANGYHLMVIGASTTIATKNIELKATVFGNNVSISYIKNKKIYYYQCGLDEINLNSAEWIEYKPAKTHSVCYDIYNSNNLLTFVYVGLDDKLYLSRVNENEETLIDENVCSVCVGNSNNTEDASLYIVYIKNGEVVYKTLKNQLLSNIQSMGLPNAKYITVSSLVSESQKSYIIATDENFNNYICSSVMAPDIAKLIENVKFDISLTLNTFVRPLSKDNSIEYLSYELAFTALCLTIADKVYQFKDITNLNLECNVKFDCFEVDDLDFIKYGVEFNTLSENNADPIGNCVYVDDCANFTPALITYNLAGGEEPVFSENSWEDKWPFNQIKPCLMKDGQVVHYLNPINLTESEDGTVTNIDITSGESGDVMVEIPKIYFRINETPDKVWQFKITNKKRFGYFCRGHMIKGKEVDKIYIGVYPSTFINNKAYSISNGLKAYADYLSVGELRAYSQNKGENYEMPNLHVSLMLQMLFIIYFKSISYKLSVGIGYGVSNSTSYKYTGLSDSYPSKTYAYLQYTNQKVDRLFNIEGFGSFANYCLDGVYATETTFAILDHDSRHNNWVGESHKDYMMWESPFPTKTSRSLSHIVNNYVGLLPTSFEYTVVSVGMDFFRTRLTALNCDFYRVHYPCLGPNLQGVFSYLITGSNYSNRLLGHRLIYFKTN